MTGRIFIVKRDERLAQLAVKQSRDSGGSDGGGPSATSSQVIVCGGTHVCGMASGGAFTAAEV